MHMQCHRSMLLMHWKGMFTVRWLAGSKKFSEQSGSIQPNHCPNSHLAFFNVFSSPAPCLDFFEEDRGSDTRPPLRPHGSRGTWWGKRAKIVFTSVNAFVSLLIIHDWVPRGDVSIWLSG